MITRALTDAEALRQLSPAARKVIRANWWRRCRREPNGWHAPSYTGCDCMRRGTFVPHDARALSAGKLAR